jgi:type II secretion system protein J
MQPGFLGKSAWSAADDAQLLLVKAESVDSAEPLAGTSRVGYRHSGDRVERLFWPAPDTLAPGWPRVQEALGGVKSLRVRFLSDSALWRDAWPFPQDPRARPNGVEIKLTLDGGETITRFFSLI